MSANSYLYATVVEKLTIQDQRHITSQAERSDEQREEIGYTVNLEPV